MIVVSDTSPITALLQIGRGDLLKDLYHEVIIPEAVRNELLQTHSSLPTFLRCEPVRNKTEVTRLRNELDLGEAEAIILAKEFKADALLIDELEGRRIARREGVPFIGLLGVLVQAKQMGFIPSVRQMIDQIETVSGFHLSKEIKEIALRKAGEF